MGPIDYTGAFRGLENPADAMFRGYQQSAAIRDDKIKMQMMQQEMLQQQAQRAAQLRMQQELSELAKNPTADGIMRASIRYPQLSEQFKRSHGMLSEEQQKAKIEFGSRVLGAAMSGEHGLSAQLLRDQADALENSGDKAGSMEHKQLANWAEKNPQAFQTFFGIQLAGGMGDKFTEAFDKFRTDARAQEKQPAEVAKAVADAQKARAEVPKAYADAAAAQVTANNLPTKAALENENTASTIRARESDIALRRIETELKVKEAAAARELDPAKKAKLEAETEEIRAKVAAAKQTAGTAAQNDYDAASDALGTLARIKEHPGYRAGLSAKLAGGPGTIAGVLYAKVPGTDVADLDGLFSTLRGQQFMANIEKMKGFGQLTEAEGRRLEELAGKVDMRLSIGQLNQNIAEIESTLKRAQGRAIQKLPTTGGAFVMDHPEFGRVDEGRINKMMQLHNLSREQVLKFLKAK